MITWFQRIRIGGAKSSSNYGLRFARPLLLLQSDDWGRVGVRDRDGVEELRVAGINLGESPYDSYSLETAEDVFALSTVLKKHRDSAGRHPSLVMNFIMANVDFDRSLAAPDKGIHLVPLSDGLPGRWHRPHLFEAYRQGIEEGVFFPALHGLTHFCAHAVARALQSDGEHRRTLHTMWRAQTPYIHWRMPWIGYEFWDPALDAKCRFLSIAAQRSSISHAAAIYRNFFATSTMSACAPGYRANENTCRAWFESGIRIAQHGLGGNKRPYLDHRGMLHTFRTSDMDPAIAPVDLPRLVADIENCFDRGTPAILSLHSINLHSTIRDFRTSALSLLDELLTILETRRSDLLYVHDADLLSIATQGFHFAEGKRIQVAAGAAN